MNQKPDVLSVTELDPPSGRTPRQTKEEEMAIASIIKDMEEVKQGNAETNMKVIMAKKM